MGPIPFDRADITIAHYSSATEMTASVFFQNAFKSLFYCCLDVTLIIVLLAKLL